VATEKYWQSKAIDNLDMRLLSKLCLFFNETYSIDLSFEFTTDFFKWKLGPNNPSGRGFLTIAISNESVVGCTSATRVNLSSGNQILRAIEIGDTFTHPTFRVSGNPLVKLAETDSLGGYLNKSIFGRLVTETLSRARSEGLDLVFGTPNELSRRPYTEKLSFERIDEGKVASIAKPSLEKLWHENNSNSSYTAIRKVLQQLLKIIDWITLFWSQYTCRKFVIRSVAASTLVHDEVFWLEVSKIDSFTKFDAEYFTFRFSNNPVKTYRYFEVLDRQKGIRLGLIILRLEKLRGETNLKVVKWLFFARKLDNKLLNIIRVTLLSLESGRCTIWLRKDLAPLHRRLLTGFWSRRHQVPIIGMDLNNKGNINNLPITLFSMSDCDIG